MHLALWRAKHFCSALPNGGWEIWFSGGRARCGSVIQLAHPPLCLCKVSEKHRLAKWPGTWLLLAIHLTSHHQNHHILWIHNIAQSCPFFDFTKHRLVYLFDYAPRFNHSDRRCHLDKWKVKTICHTAWVSPPFVSAKRHPWLPPNVLTEHC